LINISNRVLVLFSSALLFVAAGCYAFTQEIYFFVAPVILLLAVLLIQHPQYLFYLLMLSIPWSVEFNFNASLGTDLPDEPLMLLAALSVVIYLVYRQKIIRIKLHPLVAVVWLQCLWTLITVITSADVVLSIKYLLAKGWYLLAFLALPIFLFEDERVLKRSIQLLLFSTMIAMMTALIRHGINRLTFETVNDSLQPFFRNHVNYSTLLIFMVPIQIAIIKLIDSKATQMFFICLLIITCIAVYFSYSRGAWLALIAGFCSYWLLKRRILVLSFLLFLSIVMASVFWLKSNDRFIRLSNDYKSVIYHSDFREHLEATYQLKDLSNAERIYRWVAGVRMVKDNWKTGLGPSTFYPRYKSYTLPAFKTYVSDNPEHSTVHNYFLLMLIEQGVLGCLLFIGLVTALFWYAQKVYLQANEKFWRIVVSAATSILIMECVINFLSDMIETDKAGSFFYLCVAVIVVADLKTKKLSNFSSNIQGIS